MGLPAGRITRLEIAERAAAFGGASFGPPGPYELLSGSVWGDLDPAHPLNADIANLDRAPRSEEGRVTYRADLCILKPRFLDNGNGWLFYELVNRGTKRALQRVNGGPLRAWPTLAEDAGTGFLMRSGYAVVWSGWQGELVREKGRMVADLPVTSDGDRPILGRCREEFILDARNEAREDTNEPVVELSESSFVAPLHYPAASLDPGLASLTVRLRETDPRATPPGVSWCFRDASHIEITKPADLDRGALFEFIYTGRDPIVLGVGLAGIRDFVSFLRHEAADQAGNPNPLLLSGGSPLPRTLGFGLSQSGRVLREFLHLGMNADSSGRPVFDGVMPVVTGSRRGVVATTPFCQTTRYSRQHEDHLYPGDQFPFAYGPLHDPISGRRGGILDRTRAAGVCPRVLHLDTESEIWSGRASLCVTDCEGADIEQPDEVRLYLASGVSHGPFPLPEAVASLAPNLLSYDFLARALIEAMRLWIDEGVPPPPSCYPSRLAGTLVPAAAARARFPAIPGVGTLPEPNPLHLRDFSAEPPRERGAYPVFVTAVDRDGNGVGGVPHPLLMAPIGTHFGWNRRRDGYAGGDLFGLFGGSIPFCATTSECHQKGDPRPSLEERYGGREGWTRSIERATEGLVCRRLLLKDDADRLIAALRTSWSIFQAI
jgi:hypothetical protein